MRGFLLGQHLFCIFINDLPDVPKYSESYLLADDLEILSKLIVISKYLSTWTPSMPGSAKNHVSLAMDK